MNLSNQPAVRRKEFVIFYATMVQITVLVFLATFVVAFATLDAPEIKIEQGVLRGKYQETWNGRTFKAFYGIPYAEPPVGDLRFKAPIPAKHWKDTLNASEPPTVCPQINVFLNDYNMVGEEDCLYLNVYSPQLPASNDNLLPVLVYIHGGGFTCGTGNPQLYGPNILLDKDVVLVTMNYRLGALGFLSTEDTVVPGNNGLKDQNLALRWIKKNIVHFGGDPDKITIFGQSAGGASTHYHVLSPLSKDLINGAIAHSGSATAMWALAPKGQALKHAKKLAKWLECPTATSKDMIKCLKQVDAGDIIKQDKQFMEWFIDPMIPFKPVIEPDVEGAFLTENPIDIIKSGRTANIPFITGFTTEDGAMKSAALYNYSHLIEDLNKDFNKLFPMILQYHEMPKKDYVSKEIRERYFGDRDIDDSMKSELTDLFTDSLFASPQNAALLLHIKYSKQPVYCYVFGYRGTASYGPLFGDPTHDYGVCHGDELFHLLSSELIVGYKPNDAEKEMINLMTTLWTNFAKTGNPTPGTSSLIPNKWMPVQSSSIEYYFIKSPKEASMAKGLNSANSKFWKDIPTTIRDEL